MNALARKLKRMRDLQKEEKSRPSRCQDPDSCPGFLRRRQTKREKQAASVSPEETCRSSLQCQRANINKTEYQTEKVQMHETDEISDNEPRSSMPDITRKYENANVKEVSGSNISTNCANCNVCRNIFKHETDTGNKTQNSHRAQKEDIRNLVCEKTSACENFIETQSTINSVIRLVDVMSGEGKSLESKGLPEINCPSSKSNIKSEGVGKKDFVSQANSIQPVPSTFRVSSRVSGPQKHIVTVKWINYTLSQHLTKAMPYWAPDWRKPIVDLYVNITSSHFIIGVCKILIIERERERVSAYCKKNNR